MAARKKEPSLIESKCSPTLLEGREDHNHSAPHGDSGRAATE